MPDNREVISTQDTTDGSRASYPDDDGATVLGFGKPAPGNEDVYIEGVAAARRALSDPNSATQDGEALHAPVAPDESIDTVDLPGTLDWQERQQVLRREYGFMATSTDEINRAFAVIPFIGRPGGAAKHLHEVNISQNKNAGLRNPGQAVPSIVGRMGTFYNDARKKSGLIKGLLENLDGANPKLVPTLVSEDIEDEESLQSLLLHKELERSVRDGDRQILTGGVKRKKDIVAQESGQLVLSTQFDQTEIGKANKADILEQMEEDDWTVNSIRRYAEAVLASHQKREEFWADRLEESKAHDLARRAVDKILA